jgi:D-aspartate ligase
MTIGDVSSPVVILRLDHHGALGIARSLGRLGVAVYGVHTKEGAPASRSRYCRRGFVWDLDAAPPAESVSFLLSVARKIGGRPILLPSNDETALFVAENAAALQQRFTFPVNSAALVRTLFEKQSMFLLAKEKGIPTPETAFPNSRADVVRFCATARFPVVLKASDGIAVARRTGKKMVIVRTADELIKNYEEMADPQNPDLILQEYIPGDDGSVWMFNGYFDENSDCLVGFTGRKIHQYPVYTGMTSLGICLENKTVDELTRRFMKAIGYRGILDIGYRYDARDQQYKVLDVNPRVGATFRLFVAENGMDVVRAMYLDMTGQPVPPSATHEGRKWIVENMDLISTAHYFRDGILTFPTWLRSLRGIEECAWFAKDDLRPFGDMCGALMTKIFKKAARTVNGKLTHKHSTAERVASGAQL